MHRKTEAVIDLAAVRSNFALASSLAPNSNSIAVIKANAYGHGLVPVAKALQARALAVAILDEALELREAGIRTPVLVLEGVNNGASLKTVVANNLTIVAHNAEQIEWLAKARLEQPVSVWLKVDTGMHRLGLPPTTIADIMGHLGNCRVAAVCTHLAAADDLNSDATKMQIDVFNACVSGIGLPLSIANSAGILAWPESHADYNRPGYMLFGHSPMMGAVAAARALIPAMALRSEIIALHDVGTGESVGYGGRWTAARPSRIATVAIGYADGYPRRADDGTPTFVNGRLAPLAGRVSMDMLTIDVTDHSAVAVGDIVELWGCNVSVNEVAKKSATIGYELLTGVTARVPRVY